MAYVRNLRYPTAALSWSVSQTSTFYFAGSDFENSYPPSSSQDAVSYASSFYGTNLPLGTSLTLGPGSGGLYYYLSLSTTLVTVNQVIYSNNSVKQVVYNGTTVYDNTPETTITIHTAVTEHRSGQDGSNGDVYIAGGWNGSATQSGVTRINSSLVKQTNPTALSSAVTYPSVGGNGNSIYIAGGITSGSTATTTINRYLTGSKQTNLTLAAAAAEFASASHSSVVYFGGGRNGSSNVSNVGYITTAAPTTRSAASSGLSTARYSLCGGVATNIIYFAGGRNLAGTYYEILDIYNTSGGRTGGISGTTSGLSQTKDNFAAARCGGGVLFGGGYNPGVNAAVTTVDLFNSSGTKTGAMTGLSSARALLAGGNTSSYAFFVGGAGGGFVNSTIDTYNTSGVKQTPALNSLSTGIDNINGYDNRRNDTWAIFSGGWDGGQRLNQVRALRNEMIFS
jgi:hypothetical protein